MSKTKKLNPARQHIENIRAGRVKGNRVAVKLLAETAIKTAENNFVAAFRYALEQGFIEFNKTNFRGWQDDCNCASCRSQRIIVDFLWPAGRNDD